MPANSSTSPLKIDGFPATGGRRRVLWIGGASSLELAVARTAVAAQVPVIDAESPQAALAVGGPTPTFAMLAADRPGRFTVADALPLSRAWPLMPIVSVASSLVDGRRRSGPQLPGIEEIPWHDLPGRCSWWLTALDEGRPTGLGLPATARREDRLLEPLGGIRSGGRPVASEVSVAAARADDLEGLCDLLQVAGHKVVHRQLGRPRLDETATTLVWDVGDLVPPELEWLRLLAANRPSLFIVVLDSFPRGDTVLAALRAGAAVLGRPISLEALAGTLQNGAWHQSCSAQRLLPPWDKFSNLSSFRD